jgi:hypothetical protein
MTDVKLRQFLLRQLPTNITERLEEAILLEDGFAERLRGEEFDLLDDYAASRLTAQDAAAVERYLLGSAENLNSIRVARALERHAGVGRAFEPEQAGPTLVGAQGRWSRRRVSSMALLLAACLAAVVLIPAWLMLPNRPNSGAAVRDVPTVGPAAGSLPGLAPAVELPVITLLTDINRGAKRPSLKFNTGATAIRLQVEVPEQAPETLYSIHIKDTTGRRLLESNALTVHAAGPYRFVEAVVPVAALGPGDRTVLLTESGAADSAPPKFTWQVTGVVNSSFPK